MLFKDSKLQNFYNKLLIKGADRLILDTTMALDIVGNYQQIIMNNQTIATSYLRRKYKDIRKSIRTNQTISIFNSHIYHC